MQRLSKFLLIAFMLISSNYISPAYAEDIVSAKWEAQQIRFHYSGFTSYYTCDSIRYKVKLLLRAIGARDDVRVESTCTGRFSEIQRFHKLLLAFAVPVAADKTDITQQTFAARWQQVQLRYNRPRNLDRGDCELVEQFNRQVVNKIGARNIEDKSRCIPHRHSLNSPNLSMTLLIQQGEIELESAQD
ncbi:MAG: hypothetical protein IIB73_13155 [Proteobacteria bacterium]|nr:hypothetical protein [Pseudomonadota bacterium]